MEFEVAKEKAVKFIGISKKTAFEVHSKLKKLNVSESTIKEVIDYLTNLGYIDDVDYVKAFVRQCQKMQKYSIYEIKQKLLIKGISKELVQEYVDKLYSSGYEKEVVNKLLRVKLNNYEVEKQKNYLYRRGFKINE